MHAVVLRLSAVLELAIGIALLVVPGAVIRVLIGASSTSVAEVLARVLGGALLALGVIGMLSRSPSGERAAAVGFAIYDVSTAVVLASAAIADDADGRWLWPVVVLHSALAVALIVSVSRLSGRLRAVA